MMIAAMIPMSSVAPSAGLDSNICPPELDLDAVAARGAARCSTAFVVRLVI